MTGSTVILNITHPKDPHLLKKSAWFSEQPGITILSREKSIASQGLGNSIRLSTLPAKEYFWKLGRIVSSFILIWLY